MNSSTHEPPEEHTKVGVQLGTTATGIKVFLFLSLLAAVIFAALWINERARPPIVKEVPVERIKEVLVEKIKEVPVEKIKEVPVEIVKQIEVPAKLTDEQMSLIDIGTRMLNRPIIKSDAEILYKIPAFRVSIFLPDSIKGIVSDEAIRNKLELALRRNRIKMDDAASVGLALNVNALWNEGKTFASTTISLSVVDSVTLARTGDLRSAFVPVYNDLQFGYAGSLKLKEQVMGAVDELAETFANKHLATQEKENQPTPAR